MQDWKISKQQKKLLDSLFKGVKTHDFKNVVDMGSGSDGEKIN